MTEYLYVPNDDSEYGPVWLASEASEHFDPSDLEDARPAKLVVSLDGHRGHYLAAGFLREAASLLEDATLGIGTTIDLSAPEHHTLRDRVAEVMDDARESAATYETHNAIGYSPDPSAVADYGATCQDAGAADGEQCDRCAWIHETADAAESVLSDLGYVTEWNDGVTVHRVAPESEDDR